MQNVRVWVAAEFFDRDLEFQIAATAGKSAASCKIKFFVLIVECNTHDAICADDVESKLKSTHTLIGNWRAMVYGPRVVVWNVCSPDTEIHLLHDGLMIQGDSVSLFPLRIFGHRSTHTYVFLQGRSMWLRADALHPDRYKQYFINTVEAVRILSTRYNTSQVNKTYRLATISSRIMHGAFD